ncbi:MAG: methionine--tRNA ligase, partial [Candidatus Omnitrophica bacterium]|nr:methionine--tRNA ligase [Candidatus Omnitrophota bacterium]
LYVLQINLGKEKRQLVAGLKKYYSKGELENKKIIVVTNLKHAKLRGIESHGMLLAAEDDGGNVGLLEVKQSEPGNEVKFGNLKNSNKEISFENFQKINIEAKGGKVYFNDLELKTDKESVSVEKVESGKIR